MPYYFDTLPVHPKPRQLESLTSYLTRVAEANEIRQPAWLFSLMQDEAVRGKRIDIRRLVDNPLQSLGAIAATVSCNVDELLATTFYHLARKFNRPTLPISISQFLAGSVSKHLRYCPSCLAERSYYSLLWRFSVLSGCADHKNRLLDRCEHCSYTIPLFASLLKIGTCPTCKRELQSCRAPSLSRKELLAVWARTRDFAFLLSPQDFEVKNGAVVKHMGWYLAEMRRRNTKFAAQWFAVEIDAKHSEVIGIENGHVKRLTAKFQAYVKYADYFGVSLQDAFTAALSASRDNFEADHLRSD